MQVQLLFGFLVLSVGKNKEALIEFFLEHLKHVEKLPTILGNLEIFVSHGKWCHHITRNINGEIVIEETALICIVTTKKRIHVFSFTPNMLPQPIIVVLSSEVPTLMYLYYY